MFVLLMGTWAGIRPAPAQYTFDYQTNIISGVTSNWAGNYVVGSNTFANALLIRNAGVLTNADGYVGYLSDSSSNYVMVSRAPARCGATPICISVSPAAGTPW